MCLARWLYDEGEGDDDDVCLQRERESWHQYRETEQCVCVLGEMND